MAAGCGERSPEGQGAKGATPGSDGAEAEKKIDDLIREIEGRRAIHIKEWSELEDRLRERQALTDQLLGLGRPAARRVMAFLERRVEDGGLRQWWLPILLQFKVDGLEPLMTHVQNMALTVEEWRNIAYRLPRHREEWAFVFARQFSRSPDTGTRLNALRALFDWDRREAREIVINLLRSDPDPAVRQHAAGFGTEACFAGSMEELKALLDALEDPADEVASSAAISLEAIVDPAIAPPHMILRDDADEELYEKASKHWLQRWLPWFEDMKDTLVWDSGRRRFTIRPR